MPRITDAGKSRANRKVHRNMGRWWRTLRLSALLEQQCHTDSDHDSREAVVGSHSTHFISVAIQNEINAVFVSSLTPKHEFQRFLKILI